MKREALKMNICNMINRTSSSKNRCDYIIKTSLQITEDADKEERLKKQNCKACFYISRVSGQAFTSQPCMSCGEEQLYSNTDTDALCHKCAKETGLCKHCGGDIHMKVGRRKWPLPK